MTITRERKGKTGGEKRREERDGDKEITREMGRGKRNRQIRGEKEEERKGD